MDEKLLTLWGKTSSDDRYHPALYHMLDVAHAAQVLTSGGGSARVRAVLEHGWRGANTDALFAWLPFLVSLHDLGKISAPFQGQRSTPEAARQADRVAKEGFVFPTASVDTRLPHSILSALFIRDHLATLESDISGAFKTIVRDAASGHHGRFDGHFKPIKGALARLGEPAHWEPLRFAGYRVLRDILAPRSGAMADIGTPRHIRPATIALTGLIILADWLGSNADLFPPDHATPLEDYLVKSQGLAQNAVAFIGFDAPRQPPADTTCGALFPACAASPRPLQALIDALTPDQLHTPALYILEAPTGEGKTEAALTLARRLAAHGASDELFFALPTMATSNQMFKRTRRMYERLYGDKGAVKLAHGQATLVEAELKRAARLEASYTDQERDDDQTTLPSGEHALAWFSSSKRALLAPFGTGTVDQVELAGLNTRYYMLRLFGLAGKTVIIDEVHAYDTYMNAILDHTLTWLAALGSTVILLSATLPARRHGELAAAFERGLGAPSDAPPAEQSAPDAYPLLARYAAAGRAITAVAAFRPEQRLGVSWLHDETPSQQAQRLLDLVAQGGVVARICNRVADAQAIYAAVQALAGADDTLLIHARMPLDERTRREQAVENLVGPNSARDPSRRIVIIGTQVLEQSLDYDVDVMVSDLAPIDLLLQRAGRLHRHRRDRPHHAQPTLFVQHQWEQSALPDVRRWGMIYEPFVLYRTWQVLRGRTSDQQATLALPGDYRPLIEAVYGGYAAEDDDSALADVLRAAWAAAATNDHALSDQAVNRLIPTAMDISNSITAGGEDVFVADEEGGMQGWQAAKTRLGDRITTIPLYRQPDGRLALDPAGAEPVPSKRSDTLPLDQQQRLLKRSLPISNPNWLLTRLRKEQWHWRSAPAAFKFLAPLYLNPDGTAVIDGRLRLDPILGLLVYTEEQ